MSAHVLDNRMRMSAYQGNVPPSSIITPVAKLMRRLGYCQYRNCYGDCARRRRRSFATSTHKMFEKSMLKYDILLGQCFDRDEAEIRPATSGAAAEVVAALNEMRSSCALSGIAK